MIDLTDFQASLNITFTDQSLLRRALTHRSFMNEHPYEALTDNERLEFLGDAVLDFISADWLYQHFPESSEGHMTRMRAALVRTETLAEFARDIGLDTVLHLGKGEEESGGRHRMGTLCATFEALVGAIYLDKDVETVRQFVCPMFKKMLEVVLAENSDKDPKSLLQEWSQAQYGQAPYYRIAHAEGPEHEKEFTVEVLINGEVYAEGEGRSKQAAAQSAARNALEKTKDL